MAFNILVSQKSLPRQSLAMGAAASETESKLFEISIDCDDLMGNITNSLTTSSKDLAAADTSILKRIEFNTETNTITIDSHFRMTQKELIRHLETISQSSFHTYMEFFKEGKTDKNQIRSIGAGLYSMSLVAEDAEIVVVNKSEDDDETSSFGTRLVLSVTKKDIISKIVDDLLWRYSEFIECYALVSS